jgi:tetraacyldisaccharide 4'-kinase
VGRPFAKLRKLIAPLAGPIYAWELARRNRRFDLGVGVQRLPVPVISVGNISTGGTGKTPMVVWVCKELRSRGLRPLIAMRGYARTRDGRSDEADEYARALPDVPVIAQPDRHAGVVTYMNANPSAIDCVVLDDGFQHRQIARDADIVLVDSTRPPWEDMLLPAGDLREPMTGLMRASCVVLTHAESFDNPRITMLVGRVARSCGRATIAVSRHEWASLVVREPGGEERSENVDWLAGKELALTCAIGNPEALIDQVAKFGKLVFREIQRDHAEFSQRTLGAIADGAARSGAKAIVVTEKDWSKLSRLDLSLVKLPIVRPQLAIGFDRGRDEVIKAIDQALSRKRVPTIAKVRMLRPIT